MPQPCERMASTISVVEKASHTCARCRIRKQRCDRSLPGCSRCTSQLIRCNYSQSANALICPQAPNTALIDRGPCGFDLSPHGQVKLLQSVLDHPPADVTCSVSGLSKQALDTLGEVGVTVSDLLDDFDCSIHHWFPIVDLGQLRIETQPSQSNHMTQSIPLLLLVILLVTTRPCGHETHIPCRRLHTTLHSISAVLQSRGIPDINLIQAQALIAMYECGRGMRSQAYLALSSAVTMATLIDAGVEAKQESLHWQVSLLILDRILGLSFANSDMPLLCPPESSVSRSVETFVQSTATRKISPLNISLQKLHIMGEVTLLVGRVFQYIYRLRRSIEPGEDYRTINNDIERMVDYLIRQKESHSWPFCDPIIFSQCCLLILHQERMRHTEDSLGSKDHLALQISRRMVWDTCRMSIEMICVTNLSQLSFVSMFCTFHAAFSIVNDIGEDLLLDERENLMAALQTFSARWPAGRAYMPSERESSIFTRVR